ncbi:oxidoreductase domain-containing protein [Rhodovulum sulfidophilum]|uniref:Oxidoreductase domain-containing protein n=1 Tax=Rhodovulum sulfidophilum TaxID=35806 RepID=A0A0D6B5W9_RHOSU|nr:oxidoreductase domain-containing protein [Rhodovulum sulfidophilum]
MAIPASEIAVNFSIGRFGAAEGMEEAEAARQALVNRTVVTPEPDGDGLLHKAVRRIRCIRSAACRSPLPPAIA